MARAVEASPAPPLLATVRGQPTAIATLRRALREARVHHAYLFEGPDGVGKELTAFGLAQTLVCERRAEGSADACGACRSCQRAVPRTGEGRPMHPDVVVLSRGLYDPSLIGRKTPETQDLSIDQVRTLVLARAAFPPTEGRAKVFVVRRAEELSVSAANALLKTLEEPGPRTHFVLLSSVGDALLPTIRSRVQRVRFGQLPESVVVDLLAEHGIERARAAELARIAGGSLSAALGLADPDATSQREELVSRALAAVDAPNSSLLLDFAELGKKLGKDALSTVLEAIASALAARARDAARGPEGSPRAAEAIATRYFRVLEALRQLDANASAQLALEAMLLKMRG